MLILRTPPFCRLEWRQVILNLAGNSLHSRTRTASDMTCKLGITLADEQRFLRANSSDEARLDVSAPHYNQRIIEVEHGSFSPFVFLPFGGNGREAKRFLTKLAQKLSDKSRWIIAL